MYMYIYVYTYICIYIYIQIYTYIKISGYNRIRVWRFWSHCSSRVCGPFWGRLRCRYKCICLYVNMHVCIYMYAYTCMYIHVCIHTYLYMFIHMHVSAAPFGEGFGAGEYRLYKIRCNLFK
jgi:hypothetical protein